MNSWRDITTPSKGHDVNMPSGNVLMKIFERQQSFPSKSVFRIPYTQSAYIQNDVNTHKPYGNVMALDCT